MTKTVFAQLTNQEYDNCIKQKLILKKSWRKIILDALNVQAEQKSKGGRPSLKFLESIYENTPWGRKQEKDRKQVSKDLKDDSSILIVDHSER